MRRVIRIVSACPQGVFQWQGRRIIVVMIRMFVTMLMTIVMRMAASPRQQRAGVFVVRQMQRRDERLHDQANRHQHSEKLRERRVACSRESHSGWRALGASSFRRLTTLRFSRVAIQAEVRRARDSGLPPAAQPRTTTLDVAAAARRRFPAPNLVAATGEELATTRLPTQCALVP